MTCVPPTILESTTPAGLGTTANGHLGGYGAWATVSASTPHDADSVRLMLGQSNNATIGGVSYRIALGIGPVGAEEVLIEDIFWYQYWSNSASAYGEVRIPLSIPAGSRLAISIAAPGSMPLTARVTLVREQLEPAAPRGRRAMTYGINGTLATRLPGSTTIGVKGAWTEITDATDIPTHLLMLWLSQVWITGFNLYRIDVATGPIGDEEIIVPDLQASTDGAIAQWYYSGPWNVDFPIGIPTGTRIIARVACDTTASAGQRDHSLAATIVTFASVLVARTGELRLGGVHTTSLDRLISWPDTLPIPLITPYDEQIAEVALRTPMEVGPAKVRRRFTKSWRVFKVAFDLDQEQRDTMIDFFVNRCRDGELSFAWPNPEWADPDAASLTFRFIPPLRMAEMGVGGLWRATVGLEIPPEP